MAGNWARSSHGCNDGRRIQGPLLPFPYHSTTWVPSVKNPWADETLHAANSLRQSRDVAGASKSPALDLGHSNMTFRNGAPVTSN